MSATVHVKGISSQTSDKEVRDFFSFCGKIQDMSVTPDSNDADSTKSAAVTFEKETAAKTALLLDNTQLGPAQVQVSSAASLGDMAGDRTAQAGTHEGGEELDQEDKPRSRIVAEYLAHGYVLSDKAIEKALALDNQHGVSSRFMSALGDFDSKYKVSERTAQMDNKYGVSNRAQQGWLGFASYFEKAANTPTGQRLRGFYDQGQKQVLDVHNEARHLASLKTGKPADQTASPTAATEQTAAAQEGGAPTTSEKTGETTTGTTTI